MEVKLTQGERRPRSDKEERILRLYLDDEPPARIARSFDIPLAAVYGVIERAGYEVPKQWRTIEH